VSTFRALQFNIQFGQRWDAADSDRAPVDLDATIAEIQAHRPDLVFLQEVEQACPEGRQIEPPPNYSRIRAALSGYDGYFSYPKSAPRELPFGIGLAILSRTPLAETVRVDLPSPPVEFAFKGETKTPTDRILIGARTRLAGRELNLFNTHLLAFFMLNSSSEIHGSQRALIAEQLHQVNGPTLLAGDFNVSRHQSLLAQLAPLGFASAQTTEPTWWRKPLVLDHLFHNAALRCVGSHVSRTGVSDHHALVADFEFV
jgi:endonuclease/exonuclease/phosphatase family metal-dependent hydrolase